MDVLAVLASDVKEFEAPVTGVPAVAVLRSIQTSATTRSPAWQLVRVTLTDAAEDDPVLLWNDPTSVAFVIRKP
jgi:hypothetical protein